MHCFPLLFSLRRMYNRAISFCNVDEIFHDIQQWMKSRMCALREFSYSLSFTSWAMPVWSFVNNFRLADANLFSSSGKIVLIDLVSAHWNWYWSTITDRRRSDQAIRQQAKRQFLNSNVYFCMRRIRQGHSRCDTKQRSWNYFNLFNKWSITILTSSISFACALSIFGVDSCKYIIATLQICNCCTFCKRC